MTLKNFELSHNFELTVFELTGSDLYSLTRLLMKFGWSLTNMCFRNSGSFTMYIGVLLWKVLFDKKQQVKDLWHTLSIYLSALLSHEGRGSGGDQERIRSGSGADPLSDWLRDITWLLGWDPLRKRSWGDPFLLSEPLIGSERSYE